MLEIVRRALAALREQRAAAHAELNTIAPAIEARGADAVATPDEEARAAALVADITALDAKIDEHAARCAELEQIEARAAAAKEATAKAGLTIIKPHEAANILDIRSMNSTQLTDTVKRGTEERGFDSSNVVALIKRHRGDLDWLRNIAARSTDQYAQAFAKLITGTNPAFLTDSERAAVAVGTNSQGGYLVPTHLDPSLILTNDGSSNALRRVARVVTLTREKTWNGVSTAGVTASWDGEIAEVSDDSPTFGAPSIPTYAAQAFVQATYQAVEDIEGLASEILVLFADAKDRLEGAAHCVGSGSSQPTGIFTAIDGVNETVSTTAATIGLVDLTAIKRAVGPRWRKTGVFVMNPLYADAIRALGSAMGASYTVDLNSANTDMILGRPLIETDDAPTTQTTTALDNEVIYGDLSQFVIVDKPGSTAIEYVPHLFNTSNNLPDGRRGWFMHWRTGSDSVNDAAFQLLVDKTTA